MGLWGGESGARDQCKLFSTTMPIVWNITVFVVVDGIVDIDGADAQSFCRSSGTADMWTGASSKQWSADAEGARGIVL